MMSSTKPKKKSSASKHAMSTKQPKQKIPAAYSPYTIFFRLERHYILQSCTSTPPPDSYDPLFYDEVEHPRPAKYAHVKLPPYWYSSAHRAAEEKRRKHRKCSVGTTMSKEELTAIISREWKNLDKDIYDYVVMLSKFEKRRVAELLKPRDDDDDDGKEEETVVGTTSSSGGNKKNENGRSVLLGNLKLPRVVSTVSDAPFQAEASLPKKEDLPRDHTSSFIPGPSSNSGGYGADGAMPLKKRPIYLISELYPTTTPLIAGSYYPSFHAGMASLGSLPTDMALGRALSTRLAAASLPTYMCQSQTLPTAFHMYQALPTPLHMCPTSFHMPTDPTFHMPTVSTKQHVLPTASQAHHLGMTNVRTEEDCLAADVLTNLIRHGSEFDGSSR